MTLDSNLGLAAQTGLQASKVQCLDAFRQYLAFVRDGRKLNYDIEWNAPLKNTFSYFEAVEVVNGLLADNAVPKSYLLYKVAADVFAVKDASAAEAMLRRAKPFLNTASVAQRKAFYANYVTVLTEQNKAPQAIAVQKELIRVDGTGRARLLLLYWQNKDTKSFRTALATLHMPTCPEVDVEGSAIVLGYIGASDGYANARVDEERLLDAYLAADRIRTPEYELWARYTLGKLYVTDNNNLAAKAVLQTPKSGVNAAPGRDRYYLSRTENLLASIR